MGEGVNRRPDSGRTDLTKTTAFRAIYFTTHILLGHPRKYYPFAVLGARLLAVERR